MTTRVGGLCANVEIMVMGSLQNNVYIMDAGGPAMVVDPTDNAEAIVEALGNRELSAIVLTHSHWDHVGAAARLRALTGAKVYASDGDAKYIESPVEGDTSHMAEPCPVDVRLRSGDIVEVGEMKWKVIETPGHSSGSICLFLIPQYGCHADGLAILVSGDTLFAGTTGRTDFARGSASDMASSMKRLAKLPDDVAVLPGHGQLTTIGAERRTFALFGDEPE